jgi:FixJ family two-component response regulator
MSTEPMNADSEQQPVVLVIDDDSAMRDSVKFLFQSVGLRTAASASVSEFHQNKLPGVPSCLVLDVRLPGLSGLEFQTELAKASDSDWFHDRPAAKGPRPHRRRPNR